MIHQLRLESGPWVTVSQEEWLRAERAAGFRPKADCGPYATGGFASGGVCGRLIEQPEQPTTTTHQQLLADLSPRLEQLAQQVQAVASNQRAYTPDKARLIGVQDELIQLACATRIAGAMPEETRQAFAGGVA